MARSHEEIRSLILNAAKEHLIRFGMSKTTIDDISKTVNMAKSSLYYYFTSKDDIFRAVLQDEFQSFKSSIDLAVSAPVSIPEKLKNFLSAHSEAMKKLSGYHLNIHDSAFRYNNEIHQLHTTYADYEINVLTSIIAQGVEQNVFYVKDISSSAKILSLTLKGIQVMNFQALNETDMSKYLDAFYDIVINGLLIRPNAS